MVEQEVYVVGPRSHMSRLTLNQVYPIQQHESLSLGYSASLKGQGTGYDTDAGAPLSAAS